MVDIQKKKQEIEILSSIINDPNSLPEHKVAASVERELIYIMLNLLQ